MRHAGVERHRARVLWLVAIVSAVVHVAVLRLLPQPAPRASRARPATSIQMTFVTSDTGPAQALRARPLEHAARGADAARTERSARPEPQPSAGAARPTVAAASSEPAHAFPASPGSSPSEPAPAAPAPVADGPPVAAPLPSPDLTPRALALSSLVAALPALAAAPDARDDDLAARRGAELSAELGALANADPLRKKRALALSRDPDGSCHYSGNAIDATILPDGGVRFDDKPARVEISSLEPLQRGQLLPRGGPAEPPERPVTPEEMVAPQQLELRVRVTPRGVRAERDWFMRQTEGLRRELSDAAHERELVAGDRALRKQLDRIWCDGALPAPQRRAKLFALWDDTSADELGARGRRVIVGYVRRNLPSDSALAFPETQLAALNAARVQRDRFDPYGGVGPADAGVGAR